METDEINKRDQKEIKRFGLTANGMLEIFNNQKEKIKLFTLLINHINKTKI